MHIAWGDLGLVAVVGLVLGAGLVALFAVGVRAIAPAAPAGAAGMDADGDGRTEETVAPSAAARGLAGLCFLICAVAIGYGIYTLL
ncbi:hypothetical protein ACFFWC_19640 [Plantactinospora siamensis]|uniref:Uncharacterized protein n=1 Tax=Plantactinospora siamensis TaxID=555372 RepID=A0ABV6P4N5_9ACTN